jgi:hypothetical protein
VSTANSKAAVISSRCAIFRPATAEFRIITTHQKRHRRLWGWQERRSSKITSFSSEEEEEAIGLDLSQHGESLEEMHQAAEASLSRLQVANS